MVIIGIIREDEAIVPTADDELLPGDEVYVVVDAQHVERTLAAFGHEEREARRIVIIGGGNIGLFLAQQIEQEQPSVNVKVVETNKSRAEVVARNLSHSVVLQGDILDPDIMEEANVSSSEAVIAVTNDDETNILSSLLSKRRGSRRAITLVNNSTYAPLTPSLGIDVVVSPQNITVSTILQHVRRGRIHSVHTLQEDFGELIEAEAMETSSLVGQPLKETELPEGVIIGAVVRDGKVITPTGSTVVQTNDRVVIFAVNEAVKQVEKMFSVRLEFF